MRRAWSRRGTEVFAAFLALEYDKPVGEPELRQAWAEVEQAITNLFGMDALLEQLQAASLCVAQRAHVRALRGQRESGAGSGRLLLGRPAR